MYISNIYISMLTIHCSPLNVSFYFQWETVQYFDNKIICDLIEEKHKGIISILVRTTTPNLCLSVHGIVLISVIVGAVEKCDCFLFSG